MEEEWKTKLEKEKREHDLESEQLKEEVRSGNQIRESREQEIKRGEKNLEKRKEQLLEKSEQLWNSECRGNVLAHELEINEEYGKRMDELRKEECKRGAEMSKELWQFASEFQKHQNKERELQNELRMLREERKRTENETLRNHTVQIEQIEAKARLEYAEMLGEQRMQQEREINKLKETTRLEKEEQERQWDKKQKEQGMKQEKEINKLKEMTRLEKEEREEQWNRKQKEHEAEVDQLKDKASLEKRPCSSIFHG